MNAGLQRIATSWIPRRWLWAGFAVVGLLFGSLQDAGAQVMIYRITFSDLQSYNVDFFDGGYLVAPALGGAPALIMVNRAADTGATYTTAVSGGDFFIGLGADKRLMATYSCRGAGASALCAFGPVENSIRLKSRSFDIQVRVARVLSGGVVAASSEDGRAGADGSSGFAQHSQVLMEVDDALTAEANTLGGESGDGISVINAYLESHGFQPEDPVPQPPMQLPPGT